MRILRTLLATIAAAMPTTSTGSPWRSVEVCPWTPTFSSVSFITFIIDRAGTQHLLYFDDSSGGASQMSYNSSPRGGVWDPNCDEIVAWNSSYEPSLAIDSSGVPYAAYADDSDATWRVQRRVGGTWLDLGPPLQAGDFDQAGGLVSGAGLVLGRSDQPSLAYPYLSANELSSSALLSEWTGSGWATMPVEQHRFIDNTRLALSSDDRPMLVYKHRGDAAHPLHYAERLASGLWTYSGLDPDLIAAHDIAAKPNGTPVLLAQAMTAPGTNLSLLTRSDGAWIRDASFPGAAKNYEGGRVAVGRSGSLHVVAWDGAGNIDYLRETLRGWAVVPVTRTGDQGGWGADIALTRRGKPLIAYLRLDGMVVVAKRRPR